MRANDPRGVANLDHRVMIGKIYVGYLSGTLLHPLFNIQASGLVVSEKKLFMCFLL